MYTFDFGPEEDEYNPYRIINRALVDRENLGKARGILYILMCALRKLPRSEGRVLYRGMRGTIDKEVYKQGCVVAWPGLTSTSPDMSGTKKFLMGGDDVDEDEDDGASNGGKEKVKGTLFIIEDGWGYNIQAYSLYPEEEEILLEPERRLRVESVIESEMTIVNLRMLDTPLVLPQLFGGDA